MKPSPSEYAEYFERYVSLVKGDDIIEVLKSQISPFRAALANLPDDRAGFRYAPEKWSVRQVVGHLVDTERVFAFRALWFARGDTQPLPGYDQAPFAEVARHDQYPIRDLVDEFCKSRESHGLMFQHLEPEAWARIGTASGNPMTALGAAFIMAGHIEYHAAQLRDRYGIALDLGSAR